MKIDSFRIWRSPDIDFHKGEDTLRAADVYTPEYLAQLADAGFNGIWIRCILRDIVKQKVFPEWGHDYKTHQRVLKTVIRRAEKAGIKVFLYMQTPLGLAEKDVFWKKHPELRGVTYDYGNYGKGRVSSLCISQPQVRDYIFEGCRALSKQLPGLGGVIAITMSEFIQHCYSHYGNPDVPELAIPHGQPTGCEQCDSRQPHTSVVDILRSIHDGLHAAGNGAALIAWNWSWSFLGPQAQNRIIAAIPKQVKVMAGFERGDTKVILGKERIIDEYSLSFAGPSKRFKKAQRVAQRRGMTVMAKLQFGTTHELATVPNLPLIGNLYDKAKAMRKLGVKGFMGCWCFGNMLSANTKALNRFLTTKELPPRKKALAAFAHDYFPGCDGTKAAEAWDLFGKAMDAYPFSVPFLYWGPLNYAVAHPIEPGPLNPQPVGPSWLAAKRGDELKETFSNYFTMTELIRGLSIMTRTWWQGVALLEEALSECDAPTAQEELNTARMVGHSFQSCWNLYRAYRLRRNWKPSHLKPLQTIMRNELKHLPDAAAIAQRDKRMGFHIEPQLQMYTAASIRRKIKRLTTAASRDA